MAVDPKALQDRLWGIADREAGHLETASLAGPLTEEQHDALANLARVVRTLSLHGRDDSVLDSDPETLAEALRLLQEPDPVLE